MVKALRNKATAVALTAPVLLAAGSVHAADGWDYGQLTSDIGFDGIAFGVLSVAGALAAIYAGIKGARVILGFLRS